MARKIDLEALCAEKGLRITEQRRVIARVLSEAEDHPDVEKLYARASAIDPGISIATVYRTVRLFEEAGILDRHDFGDGRARYEPAPEAHHDHLIDVETGKVIEFVDPELEALQKQIAEKLGFRLVDHRMELYGVALDREELIRPAIAGRLPRSRRSAGRGSASVAADARAAAASASRSTTSGGCSRRPLALAAACSSAAIGLDRRRCACTIGGDRCAATCFCIANHVSWLDILALAGATGSAFVAKAELARVPAGRLAVRAQPTRCSSPASDRHGVAEQVDAGARRARRRLAR